jgi:hypothetical protein
MNEWTRIVECITLQQIHKNVRMQSIHMKEMFRCFLVHTILIDNRNIDISNLNEINDTIATFFLLEITFDICAYKRKVDC